MYVNILGYCVTVQLNSCSLLLVVFPTKRRFVGEMNRRRERAGVEKFKFGALCHSHSINKCILGLCMVVVFVIVQKYLTEVEVNCVLPIPSST
jgi:hypothetical protein